MFNRTFLRFTSGTVAFVHVVTLVPATALADTTAANGNTQVYVAPNGVPVVNIANPNSAGVSHNQYTQYNVDSRGLVLNNGTIDQLTRQSQLAGQILANTNLAKSAGVILNEVVSPNRTTLAGFTEVLGGKADVIVANPYGITCSGCGFINTDRVSLTTGTPRFGSNGSVAGFEVSGGDVLISGAGLDGTAQNYFDIVTRALRVDGQLNAHSLSLVTGAVDWDYASGSALSIDGVRPAPAYAIDSTVLGGIYADRISIVANEAGVGVRIRGDVAASADDFRIDAAGRVELLGRVSAQRDLTVSYFGSGAAGNSAGSTTSANSAITVGGSSASLTAGRDLMLAGNDGGITLNEGRVTADGQLRVIGASVTDTGSASATRFGATDVFVSAAGAARFSGTSWASGDALSLSAGSLSIDGAGTSFVSGTRLGGDPFAGGTLSIEAQSGDVDIGEADIRSPSALFLGASQGAIHIGAAASALQGYAINLGAATGITNAGSVLASSSLFLSSVPGATPIALDNSGLLQGDVVGIGSDAGRFALNNSGTVLGNTVFVTASDLRNAGRIQAATSMNLLADSLENQRDGVVLASTDAAGLGSLVVSGTLENAGSIHSAGTLGVQAATLHNAAGGTATSDQVLQLGGTNSLVNDGTIRAAQYLFLQGTNVVNNADVQTAGVLSINQAAPESGPDERALTNSASGTIIADTLQINSGAVTNSGAIQARTRSLLSANSLDNLTSSAKFVASTQSGTGSIFSLTGALHNAGVIHGVGDLTLYVGSLDNSGTAAVSSLGSLALTGATGNLTNAGLLYGAGRVDINNFEHAFINSGQVASGVPASGTGDLLFNVDTFTNRGIVTSEGNLSVTARDFQNEAAGALPQLVWGTFTPLITVTDGSFQMPVWQQIGDSGDFHCRPTLPPSDCAHSRVYQVFYTADQQVVGAMPTPAQLISNHDLRITYTGSARNIASIISGDNVSIQAGGPDAGAFLNQDFHLERSLVRKVIWERATTSNSYRVPLDAAQLAIMQDPNDDEPGGELPIWAVVPWQGSDQATILKGYEMAYSEPIATGVIPGTTVTAGIFARNLASYSGPQLNVQAGMKSTTVTPRDVQTEGGSAVVEAPAIVSPSGLNLSLPTNPNGFFVPSKSSGAGYLIETNPLYTAGDALGSDYLARLLGYNVDTLQKRLGDANYEAKLIREQLISQTGSNILGGYANEQAQIKGLMDNASSEAGALGLTYGRPLSAEQAASLKQDLVWMEEKVVSGQKVLVPVVYLAAATRESVSTGAVIGAKDVSISGGALTNRNGTIKASDKLTVETTGDITNRSGTISGGTVDLRSTHGNVVNETTTAEAGDDTYRRTTVGGTATIRATDGLSIQAGQDITVKGGDVAAGGSATLNAGRNVTVDTIQDRSADSSASSSSGGFSSSSTSTNTQTTRQIGSNVSTGGDLTVRSGGDVTVGGSQVNAGKNADVQAGGNLNIVDRQDEHTVVTRTESSGVQTDGASIGSGSSSTTSTNSTSTSVGSRVNAGGSANLGANQSVNVRGSDVAAGRDLNVKGTDINVTAGQNVTTETVHTESSANMLGASADADSAGVAMTHATSTSDSSTTSTTARGSTLRSGGDMSRNASGTIKDVGTQIDAGGNFSQTATTIESGAAANTQTTTSSSSSEKTSVGVSVDYNVGTAIGDAKNGSTAGASQASSGPTAGTNVKYRKEDSSASSTASQAVTSTIRAGGKVTSQSSGTTTLEGTQIQSGGDTTLEAGNLDVKAAKDTSQSSSNATHLDVGYRGAVDVTGAPSGTISAGYGDSNSNSASSKAVVGTITSGGNVNVRTKGDTRLEGTKIDSKGETNIDAGGTVQIDAARNTSQAASSSIEMSGSATVGKGQVGMSGRLETQDSTQKKNEAVTGSVNAGGNLNVHAGKDVKTEGTALSAGKDATVNAGGAVEMKDAVSTEQSSSSSLDASLSVSASKGSSSGKGGKGGSTRTEPGKGDPGQVMGGSGLSSSNERSSKTTTQKSTVKAGGSVATTSGNPASETPQPPK